MCARLEKQGLWHVCSAHTRASLTTPWCEETRYSNACQLFNKGSGITSRNLPRAQGSYWHFSTWVWLEGRTMTSDRDFWQWCRSVFLMKTSSTWTRIREGQLGWELEWGAAADLWSSNNSAWQHLNVKENWVTLPTSRLVADRLPTHCLFPILALAFTKQGVNTRFRQTQKMTTCGFPWVYSVMDLQGQSSQPTHKWSKQGGQLRQRPHPLQRHSVQLVPKIFFLIKIQETL